MPRSPETNLALFALAYGVGVSAGGSAVFRMGAPGPILGMSLVSLMGASLTGVGGILALCGIGVLATGLGRPLRIGIAVAGALTLTLFVAASLASNPRLLATPLSIIIIAATIPLVRGVAPVPAPPPPPPEPTGAELALAPRSEFVAETTASTLRIPPWAGVFMGPLVAGAIAFFVARELWAVMLFGFFGLIAGVVVALKDLNERTGPPRA